MNLESDTYLNGRRVRIHANEREGSARRLEGVKAKVLSPILLPQSGTGLSLSRTTLRPNDIGLFRAIGSFFAKNDPR
jgi:hypothetical protein